MKHLFFSILLLFSFAAKSQCDTMTSATFTAITTNSVNVSFTVSGSNWTSFNVTLYDSVTSAVVFNNASLPATSFTATGLSANKVYGLRTYTNVPFGGCEPYVLFPTFRTLGNIGYTPMNGNGYLYKRIAVDSTFHVPYQDTGLYKGLLRAGAIVYRSQDSSLWGYNGANWDAYAKKTYVDTKPTFGDVRDVVSDSVSGKLNIADSLIKYVTPKNLKDSTNALRNLIPAIDTNLINTRKFYGSPKLSNWFKKFSTSPSTAKLIFAGNSTSDIAGNASTIPVFLKRFCYNGGPLSGFDTTATQMPNFGSTGQTIVGFYNDSTNTAGKGIAGVIAANPDLIIFSYGINDIRQNQLTKTGLKNYIIASINKIRLALPNTDIVLRMPNSFLTSNSGGFIQQGSYPSIAVAAQAQSDTLYQAYKELENYWDNVQLFNSQDLIFGRTSLASSTLMSDGIHPNYDRIVEEIVKIIGYKPFYSQGLANNAYSANAAAPWTIYPYVFGDSIKFTKILNAKLSNSNSSTFDIDVVYDSIGITGYQSGDILVCGNQYAVLTGTFASTGGGLQIYRMSQNLGFSNVISGADVAIYRYTTQYNSLNKKYQNTLVVNTTTPLEKATINGGLSMRGNFIDSAIYSIGATPITNVNIVPKLNGTAIGGSPNTLFRIKPDVTGYANGSGTLNGIQVDLTGVTGNVYALATIGRVGIGTLTPTTGLHVATNSQFDGTISGNNVGNQTPHNMVVTYTGFPATTAYNKLFNISTISSGYNANTGGKNAMLFVDGTNIAGTNTYPLITLGGRNGMGTATPDPSLLLHLNSTTQGFRPPAMTRTQFNAISSKINGLMAYDSLLSKYLYWDGTTTQVLLDSSKAFSSPTFTGIIKYSFATLSANASLTSSNTNITGGDTYTLPDATTNAGAELTVINSTSGSITINTVSSQLIGNFTTATTFVMPSETSNTFLSNGTKWLLK